MNAFSNSQVNYCPLIWMCHSRKNNNKINRLHERCLRIIHNDKRSSFNALFEKDGSVSIHERNITILATEMFKVSENPPQMHEIFKLKDQSQYNLNFNRHNSLFNRYNFLGPLLSQSIKVLKVDRFQDQKSGIYFRIFTRIYLI